MIFLCVKVGGKYPASTVLELFRKLKKHYTGVVDMHCLTDTPECFYGTGVSPIAIESGDLWKKLQWHKTTFFRTNFNGWTDGTEVIVCDIDIDIIQNIDDLVDYTCHGFVASRRWWVLDYGELSGTWYKFRVGDHSYVDDNFSVDWQEYWVKTGLVEPPVNGEQNYVELLVEQNTEFGVEYLPDTWFTKWTDNEIRNRRIKNAFFQLTGDRLYNDKWHKDIKIVHYAGYVK
jgi:hypothetical protein